MDIEDHSTPAASVSDPMDEIANLLMGGSEPGEEARADPTQEQTLETPDTEDPDDAEKLSDESTEGDEVDESELEDLDEDPDEESEEEDEDQTLAAMLGVDESQLSVTDDGGFLLNVKIDGKDTQHPLSEVIKNFQTEGSVTNKFKALAVERKEFEQAVTTKAVEIKASLERNQQLGQILEHEIMSEYEKTDWDDLRQYDPAEWAAKRQEFASKYQRIQRVQQELGHQAQEAHQGAINEMTTKRKVYLKEQWDLMIVNNPGWSDETTYDKDMGELSSFAAKAYGYTDEDFKHVTDPRTIEMVKDAMSFRQGKSEVKKKRLKKVPKVQKRGGVRKALKVSKLDKLTKAAKTAKGANKRQLQTDAVAELLMGG